MEGGGLDRFGTIFFDLSALIMMMIMMMVVTIMTMIMVMAMMMVLDIFVEQRQSTTIL